MVVREHVGSEAFLLLLACSSLLFSCHHANMARPAKLLFTSGCKSRRGKSSGHLVADSSAGAKFPVPSGVTQAFPAMEEGSKSTARNESEPSMTSRQIIRPKGLRKPIRVCHGEGSRLRSPRADGPASGAEFPQDSSGG